MSAADTTMTIPVEIPRLGSGKGRFYFKLAACGVRS